MVGTMRLLALDGMRGVAAIWVVLVHLPILSSLYFSPLLINTYAMLTVFFVFSGFVVAMVYGRRISDTRDAARFTIKRFGRLWPLHVLTLAIMVALETVRTIVLRSGVASSENPPFTDIGTVTGIFENLFLVHAWGWDKPMEWNFPSWTISTEFVAYFVICLISILTLSVKRRILLAVCASLIAGYVFGQQTHWWTSLQGASVARCVMDFFIGYLAYFAFERWKLVRAPVVGTALEVGLLGYVFVAATLQWKGVGLLSSSFAFGGLVWVFACEQGALSRIAKTKLPVWLGNISLGVYLLHVPVFFLLSAVWSVVNRVTGVDFHESVVRPNGHVAEVLAFGGPWAMNALALVYVSIVIGAAVLAHRFVENPARVWFAGLADRWFGKPAPADAAIDVAESAPARSQ
jgi:peptidoglycan/LPS O-acetylase OafA/YrhL